MKSPNELAPESSLAGDTAGSVSPLGLPSLALRDVLMRWPGVQTPILADVELEMGAGAQLCA